LSGHVAITSGDTQDEGIVCAYDIGGNDRVRRFLWSVHLAQDLLRKGFRHSGPNETDKKDGIMNKE
jgi:hypothetical protein